MKKKLAKIIGSILLSSMVLVSVCPLSALASEEPVTETGEVTIVAEALTEEQTESIAVAESEPIVSGGQTLAEITATDPDVQIVENTDHIYYPNPYTLTLKVELPVYENMDSKETFIMKPQKVTITRTDNKNFCYLEAEDGSKGWVKIENYSDFPDLPTAKGYDVFDGLCYAD